MSVLSIRPTRDTATPRIARAAENDTNRILRALTAAFATDPAVRWMYPAPEQYLEHFPVFARAFGGAAIARGTAFVSGEGAGASLWLPPGATPDEAALGDHLAASIAVPEREDAFALFEEMGRRHPVEPHWYLPLMGVDPLRQSEGHGSAMLRMALDLCDAENLPAYLEATSARSARLYARHGFEPLWEIRVGTCPPLFPMLRHARR